MHPFVKNVVALGVMLAACTVVEATKPEWRHTAIGTAIRNQSTGDWFELPGYYYPKFSFDGRFVCFHKGLEEQLFDTWRNRQITSITGCVLGINPRAPIMLVAQNTSLNAILIDMATGKSIGDPIPGAHKMSPDGRFVVSSGWEMPLQTRVYSAITGRQLQTLPGYFCCFDATDNNLVGLSSDGEKLDRYFQISDGAQIDKNGNQIES